MKKSKIIARIITVMFCIVMFCGTVSAAAPRTLTLVYGDGTCFTSIQVSDDTSDKEVSAFMQEIQGWINVIEGALKDLDAQYKQLKSKYTELETENEALKKTAGDVNLDGSVDVQDAQIILSYYVNGQVAGTELPDVVEYAETTFSKRK